MNNISRYQDELLGLFGLLCWVVAMNGDLIVDWVGRL